MLEISQGFQLRRWQVVLQRILKMGTAIASLAIATTPVQAATITRNFVGGSAPTNSNGSGNLVDIFNTAADYWEATIQDDISTSISFGWTELSDTTLAETLPFETTFNRTLNGEILFNANTRLFNWFLDPTPQTSEEFSVFQSFSADLGGGELNTGRVYSFPTVEAATSFDLLTIAIHEIGHIFGILNFYETFDLETRDDDIDIQSPLPFTGSAIPTTPVNGGHLNLVNAAMYPFFTPGRRTLLSEADILAIATSTNTSQFNLNPQIQPVETPEPNSMLACSLLLTLAYRSKRKSNPFEQNN